MGGNASLLFLLRGLLGGCWARASVLGLAGRGLAGSSLAERAAAMLNMGREEGVALGGLGFDWVRDGLLILEMPVMPGPV